MTHSNQYHSTTNHEDAIYIRDIREHYYPIHNVILDEWRPLIGPIGLDIYNFLSRISFRENERARASYTIMQKFLGHSRSTIWTYLRLLELCELIQRDVPGAVNVIQNGVKKRKRVSNAPNNYYLLNPKRVTPTFLSRLKNAIEKEEKMDGGFKKSFYASIDNWQSFASYFPKASRPVVVPANQPSLFDPPNEENPPPSLDPKDILLAKRLLFKISIRDENTLAALLDNHPSTILAVIWHGRTEQWVNPDRFSGYVIRALEKKTEPPKGFIYLAEKWIGMTRNERQHFADHNWPYMKMNTPEEIAHQLDVSVATATSILSLIKSSSFSSFRNWIDIN